jgi:hypothetical protein
VQYENHPPDSCTQNIGQVMAWQYQIVPGAAEKIRSGSCYGEDVPGGNYAARFIWFEDEQYHCSVWQRKSWVATVHGPELEELLHETARRFAHEYHTDFLRLPGSPSRAS